MTAVAHSPWTDYDRPALRRDALRMEGSRASAQLAIDGMHCNSCALKIERALTAVPGVERVSVNGATKRMQMSWDVERVAFSRLLQTISELGFTPHVLGAAREANKPAAGIREKRTALKRLAVAGLGMAQVMSFAFALYSGAAHGMDPQIEYFLRLVSLLVTLPVVFYSATPFFSGAWRDLKTGTLGMDVPVSLATALAFAASVFNALRNDGEVYFDSVTMFVFFLLLGRYVEMQTRHRSGSVGEALARLLPDSVQRLRNGKVEIVAPADLNVGDRLLVPAGALIAADGKIMEGASTVDEALLTGESTPVSRKAGDPVLGGSLNVSQPLQIEVTTLGSGTVLAGIVRLLEQAQAERPRLGRIADRAAAWFVAGVLLVAAGVAAAWLHFDPARAFPAALAVLVVTCPCALSLATPAVIAAATTRLAKAGLLVTHADAVEALARVRHCVFDKTGTLTQGTPRVARTQTLGARSAEECLAIAATLERQSEHPLAAAFTGPALPSAHDVRVVRGHGIEGEISGTRYRIGQLDFVREYCPAASDAASDASVYLADASGLLAAFEIDDALRPEAVPTLASLRTLGIDAEIASGDHAEAVARVARRLGIQHWQARLSPEAKLERIHALNRLPGGVMMIGDGINDAPVLGAARVSVAMGGGCALAHVSADTILMSPSLTVLTDAVCVSRRALQIIRQNLAWATGYNLLAVPLAAVGAIPPWAAAIGMSVSSLVVVLNANRLTRLPPAPDKRPALPLAQA